MKGQTRRVRWRDAGFSFVELLVTIIIAGIAFSLMVPVFVQATKGISRDKVRLVAANVAQDRLEKLRQLDYDELITTNASPADLANLNNQTAWTDQTQSGKTFKIAYSSTEDVARATKLVTVKVDWVGPPTPHMTVVMSTVIYRQWVGPTISWSFNTEADPLSDTLTITATVNEEDRPSMKTVRVGTRELTGRVDFMVTPVDGAPLPTKSVDYNDTGIYAYTWSLPASDGSRDGNYAITAVAYSANGYPGNTLNTIRRIETGPPGGVTPLTATSSNGGVTLTWTKSTSGDVDRDEVWRRLKTPASGTEVKVSPVTAGWLETTFVDSNLTGTEYTYIVKAVDWAGNETSASADVLVAAAVVPAPDPAIGLTGYVTDNSNSVHLSWSPPLSPPSSIPTSYSIYKGGGAGVFIKTVSESVTTWTIQQDWGTSVDYQVKASNGLDSGWATTGIPGAGSGCSVDSGWLRATVPARTFITLSITNGLRTSGTNLPVTLLTLKLEKLLASGSWELCPTPTAAPQFTNVPNGGVSTWTGLTPDLYYRWTWTYTQETTMQDSRTSLSRLVWSPDPVPETVP